MRVSVEQPFAGQFPERLPDRRRRFRELLGELRLEEPIEGLEGGEYLYVRVVQADGGAAWSSPFFVD